MTKENKGWKNLKSAKKPSKAVGADEIIHPRRYDVAQPGAPPVRRHDHPANRTLLERQVRGDGVGRRHLVIPLTDAQAAAVKDKRTLKVWRKATRAAAVEALADLMGSLDGGGPSLAELLNREKTEDPRWFLNYMKPFLLEKYRADCRVETPRPAPPPSVVIGVGPVRSVESRSVDQEPATFDGRALAELVSETADEASVAGDGPGVQLDGASAESGNDHE